MLDWACVSVPCSMLDCKRETEKFMDHFINNGKRMVDWERAWKNWMRRSKEFAPRGTYGNGAVKPEERRPAIPTLEQVLQPPKQLSEAKRAELAAMFAERRQGR